jgi:hypothetical protein
VEQAFQRPALTLTNHGVRGGHARDHHRHQQVQGRKDVDEQQHHSAAGWLVGELGRQLIGQPHQKWGKLCRQRVGRRGGGDQRQRRRQQQQPGNDKHRDQHGSAARDDAQIAPGDRQYRGTVDAPRHACASA